jgi:membrane protein implicated in regulation of membrane protease activity
VTILKIFFLAAFIGGLVLAVFAMLHGVEHMRRRQNRTRKPSPFFNLPAVAAFAVGFGAVGYPLASRTTLPAWGILLIAIGGGALAVSGMITLLARWALRGLSNPLAADEGHEIQGHLAVVTDDITPDRDGEISFEHLDRRERVRARSLGTAAIRAGSEVVIDRIEGGVAFVEEWAVVEQRL